MGTLFFYLIKIMTTPKSQKPKSLKDKLKKERQKKMQQKETRQRAIEKRSIKNHKDLLKLQSQTRKSLKIASISEAEYRAALKRLSGKGPFSTKDKQIIIQYNKGKA
tara:strand:- start:129 stop:449 length:321 start_codon:yes stop_codon:yes gene_type:complete